MHGVTSVMGGWGHVVAVLGCPSLASCWCLLFKDRGRDCHQEISGEGPVWTASSGRGPGSGQLSCCVVLSPGLTLLSPVPLGLQHSPTPQAGQAGLRPTHPRASRDTWPEEPRAGLAAGHQLHLTMAEAPSRGRRDPERDPGQSHTSSRGRGRWRAERRVSPQASEKGDPRAHERAIQGKQRPNAPAEQLATLGPTMATRQRPQGFPRATASGD